MLCMWLPNYDGSHNDVPPWKEILLVSMCYKASRRVPKMTDSTTNHEGYCLDGRQLWEPSAQKGRSGSCQAEPSFVPIRFIQMVAGSNPAPLSSKVKTE